MGCLRILFILIILSESPAALTTRWCLCVLFDRITGLTGWGVAAQTDCHDGPVLKRMGCLRILFILIILSEISGLHCGFVAALGFFWTGLPGLTGWGLRGPANHDAQFQHRRCTLDIDVRTLIV